MAKFIPLEDQEWVVKAASTDKARPVLTWVNIDDFGLAATDGHRLHVVVRRNQRDMMQKGSWNPKRPGLLMDGSFPNYWQIIHSYKVDDQINVIDPEATLPVLKAVLAYSKERGTSLALVSLPITGTGQRDGHGQPIPAYVRVDARYLLDILAGRMRTQEVLYLATGPISPVLFLLDGYTRLGLLMPVRSGDSDKPDTRFDLSEFVERWQHAGKVPEVVLPGGEIQTPGGSSEKTEMPEKTDAS